jgi:hypothetical protein
MSPLRTHTALRPLRRAPAATSQSIRLFHQTLGVTSATLPIHQPNPRPSTTARACPTSFANADKIPSQASNRRAAQLGSHFSSSSPSSTSAQQSNMTSSLPTRGGFESKGPSVFTTRKVGAPHTLEHRIYIEKDGVPVSPFHDIPLYANEQQTVLNMVVEIPRWTNAKQEVRWHNGLDMMWRLVDMADN